MIKDIVSMEYPLLGIAALYILMNLIIKLVRMPEAKSGLTMFVVYYFLLYFFIGFLFAFLFYLSKNDFNPTLDPFGSIYFSFVTLATTGFGDFHPNPDAHLPQILIILENAVGHFLSVFIAAYIIVKKMNK